MASHNTSVKTRYISWVDIHKALITLVNRMSSTFKPDVIIAVAKGGLIPARIVSDLMGVDEIGYIEVKFYKAIGVRSENHLLNI